MRTSVLQYLEWVQSRELVSKRRNRLRLITITVMDPFFNDGYDLPYNSNTWFSQSECTYMNHAQASELISPLSGPILSAITAASHEVLTRSGNVAYASIHALHLQAKYELQAQRGLVTQLQDVIHKLTSSQNPSPQISQISWTKKTPKAASYLAHVLKTNFPKFRYCDGDWKVERFGVIKYPDWCCDARDSRRLMRARPSKHKIGDGSSTNDNRRRKKVKASGRSTAPPGTQVINSGNGVLPGSVTSHAVSSLVLPSAATPQDFPSASIAPPSLCLIPQESSTPPIVPSTPPFEGPSTSPHMPVHSNVPALSLEPNSPNPLSLLSPPTPIETLPSQVEASENTITGFTADLDICGPHAMETAPVEQGEQVQPHQIDPFSNGGEHGPICKAKAGKLMVASSTVLTACNLFVLNYLKEHSNNLRIQTHMGQDSFGNQKGKYEALSKERKAASRLAATATTNAPAPATAPAHSNVAN
ncbi:hypothetical protein BC826DRAFT_973388 [Russula brevipes]|nr:hypothetical protein BC826DRAFT_973388 [Russula brevipes]